ncbi:MAG: MFS transporter [Pseudomonadota bacterium]
MLTYANVGGAVGGFLFGFLMKKWHIKWPTILMLLVGSAMVVSFGLGRGSLPAWQWATMLCGFCTNAAIVGYYAAYASGFPAYARATGTGFVLGIGRLGAAGSPILAGTLFDHFGKSELFTVSVIMALGSIVSAVLFFLLRSAMPMQTPRLQPPSRSFSIAQVFVHP